MTRDDIIKMAHEASPDMTWYAGLDDPTNVSIEELEFLERFAALVAAAEREAVLDLVDANAKNNTDLAAAIRARGQE